ncbi:hypothetical protein RN04_12435 [Arthrobacter sp. W1]|nr:hypothetical protein RN04_12435 [Arthrobacter sp. W1]
MFPRALDRALARALGGASTMSPRGDLLACRSHARFLQMPPGCLDRGADPRGADLDLVRGWRAILADPQAALAGKAEGPERRTAA